jgi:hypothetical protein
VIDFDVDVSADDTTVYVTVRKGASGSSVVMYDRGPYGFTADPKSGWFLRAVNKPHTLTYAADISATGREFLFSQFAPAGGPATRLMNHRGVKHRRPWAEGHSSSRFGSKVPLLIQSSRVARR